MFTAIWTIQPEPPLFRIKRSRRTQMVTWHVLHWSSKLHIHGIHGRAFTVSRAGTRRRAATSPCAARRRQWVDQQPGKSLKRLVEGDSEINTDLISSGRAAFSSGWTVEQVGVLSRTLYELDKKGNGEGIPPFHNTLNKLLHFLHRLLQTACWRLQRLDIWACGLHWV